MRTGHINAKTIMNCGGFRIDPDVHLSEGVSVRQTLNNLPYELSTVGDNSEKVFLGNIFSRVFVADSAHGMPYLAASDTVLADIETGRFLSKKQAAKLENLILKQGWILVTCSGTLGNVTYTNKTFENHIATHDLIRIVPNNEKVNKGTLYAFLSSKYGYFQITQSQFGGVVKHINDSQAKEIVVPVFPASFQQEVDDLIQESARLREEATDLIEKAERILIEKACLRDLTSEDYNYFGPRSYKREVSCFVVKRSEISTTTINAFNLSRRTKAARELIKVKTLPLADVLKDGDTFSSPAVSSTSVKPENGILFINQKDIFDNIIKGKYVSKRNIQTDKLVQYGEVLVACDGTLGEGELFCHCLFANEDLNGALISTHFLRMITNDVVPSGYLFCWLNSKFGFRFIRSTQAGTKLCHPIPKLILDIPVPILDQDEMLNIDNMIKAAFSKRFAANCNERKAIQMVEQEIEKWGN